MQIILVNSSFNFQIFQIIVWMITCTLWTKVRDSYFPIFFEFQLFLCDLYLYHWMTIFYSFVAETHKTTTWVNPI